MDLGLIDKVCVVLASTRGLGLAAAEALLDEGARVALAGRDAAAIDALRVRLGARHGERATVDSLDVNDSAALRAHLDRVRSRWGTVHTLVTNSGGPPTGSAAELDGRALAAALPATFAFAVDAIHHVLPWMRAQRFGRVIAMTSIAVRQPIAGLALSNSLRAGLTGYLKTLASEVASDGVTVNSIATGMFETDRLRELFAKRAERNARTIADERDAALRDIPTARFGRLEEYGALVAFMASERAGFLNGVALAYDGGASRSLL